MSDIAAELCDYKQFFYSQANRIRDFEHAAGNLLLMLVLDHKSVWPVAKCAVEQMVYFGNDENREQTILALPCEDGEVGYKAASFTPDGYWIQPKSSPLHVENFRALNGCVIEAY
jgi:hypothetical protein